MASLETFGYSSNWLSSLIDAGADAMTNLYYADFSGSSMIKDEDSGKYTVRLSNISGLPAFSHKTETKKFMTVDFDAPINDFDFEKKLTLEFRLDQNYELYTKLVEIMGQTAKPSLGYATTGVTPHNEAEKSKTDAKNNLKIVIKIPTNIPQEDTGTFNGGYGNKSFIDLYEFTYCWIPKVNGLESFSYDNSGSRTVKAEVYYYDWDGPKLI